MSLEVHGGPAGTTSGTARRAGPSVVAGEADLSRQSRAAVQNIKEGEEGADQ